LNEKLGTDFKHGTSGGYYTGSNTYVVPCTILYKGWIPNRVLDIELIFLKRYGDQQFTIGNSKQFEHLSFINNGRKHVSEKIITGQISKLEYCYSYERGQYFSTVVIVNNQIQDAVDRYYNDFLRWFAAQKVIKYNDLDKTKYKEIWYIGNSR